MINRLNRNRLERRPLVPRSIIGLESEYVLFLGQTCQGAFSGAAVCTHVLYTALECTVLSKGKNDAFFHNIA